MLLFWPEKWKEDEIFADECVDVLPVLTAFPIVKMSHVFECREKCGVDSHWFRISQFMLIIFVIIIKVTIINLYLFIFMDMSQEMYFNWYVKIML